MCIAVSTKVIGSSVGGNMDIFLSCIHILISVIFIYFRRGKVRTMGKTLMKGVLQEVGQSHIKLFVFRK